MTWKHWILFFASIAITGLVFLLPRIPQNQDDHCFADNHEFLGISRFLNVASNIIFMIVGCAGLRFVHRSRTSNGTVFSDSAVRLADYIFFATVAATAFGSACYHLVPDNNRLVWDRLPMAVAFMALLATVVLERMAPKGGVSYLALLVAAGVGRVWYWRAAEQRGQGDLHAYVFVQFGSLVAIGLMMALFPARFTRGADLLGALAIYAGAKVFEKTDLAVFRLGGIVSGHSLKHIAAAVSAHGVLRMLD